MPPRSSSRTAAAGPEKHTQNCAANFLTKAELARKQKHRIQNFYVSIYFRKSVQFPIVERLALPQ
jgi:hypothetical protein